MSDDIKALNMTITRIGDKVILTDEYGRTSQAPDDYLNLFSVHSTGGRAMSEDIVKRLRRYADQIRREYEPGDPAYDEDCAAMTEAADRIEALEAENARLREALGTIEDTAPMWEVGGRGPSNVAVAVANALVACRVIARAALHPVDREEGDHGN